MPEQDRYPRLIHFPADGQPIPCRVYLTQKVNKLYWRVAPRESDARRGWGGLVQASRLLPYTPELWAACQEYITRRKQLRQQVRDEYNRLIAGQTRLL